MAGLQHRSRDHLDHSNETSSSFSKMWKRPHGAFSGAVWLLCLSPRPGCKAVILQTVLYATACKWDTGNSSPLFPHKDRTNRLCIFVLCYCFGKQNFIAVVPDVTKTIKIELLTKPQIPHSASNQISSQTHLEYKATNNKGISIRLNWTAHLCLLLHGTKDFLSAKNLYSHLQSLSSPGFLHPAYKARL